MAEESSDVPKELIGKGRGMAAGMGARNPGGRCCGGKFGGRARDAALPGTGLGGIWGWVCGAGEAPQGRPGSPGGSARGWRDSEEPAGGGEAALLWAGGGCGAAAGSGEAAAAGTEPSGAAAGHGACPPSGGVCPGRRQAASIGTHAGKLPRPPAPPPARGTSSERLSLAARAAAPLGAHSV